MYKMKIGLTPEYLLDMTVIFEKASPQLWNRLPLYSQTLTRIVTFKKPWKTHLLRLEYSCIKLQYLYHNAYMCILHSFNIFK